MTAATLGLMLRLVLTVLVVLILAVVLFSLLGH
jgi:hypothetical protein